MNKKTILIIGGAIVILIAIIGLAFVFLNNPEPISKCGDGVCDTKEKANPKLCPMDCGVETDPTQESNYDDSPFGLNTGFGGSNDNPIHLKQTLEKEFALFNELDIGWLRGVTLAGIAWDYIEPVKADFNFELTDVLMVQADNHEITFLPLFLPYNKWAQTCYSNNDLEDDHGVSRPKRVIYCNEYEKDYINYVKEVVERYDGDDNFGNYKVSEITKKAIKNHPWVYWEVMNEPYNQYFEGTPEEYERILTVTYKAIKETCPKCNVLIGGFSEEVFQAGVYGYAKEGAEIPPQEKLDMAKNFLQIASKKENYDIMNFHAYFADDAVVAQRNYYNHPNTWMTELGYPSVKFVSKEPVSIWGENTSEKEQAEILIKRFITGFSIGIKKIFWNTWKDSASPVFGNTGLITKQNEKKLSYYSYKLLIDKLEGSDWDNIQTIQESDNVYIYKFMKNGEPIWVAWNDDSESKTISLDIGSIGSVKITEAVPKYESGKEVTDYNTAFNTETKTVSGGKVEIILEESPVFVEGN